MCALESADPAHERRRKALTHILLVPCGRQYREDRVEQAVIDAAADGIGWRNRRAGLDIRWEEALRRGRQVWWPPSWGVRKTWRLGHERIQIRAMPFLLVGWQLADFILFPLVAPNYVPIIKDDLSKKQKERHGIGP